MINNTISASPSAPLTGNTERRRPIVAAIGATNGAHVLEAARLVADRVAGGAMTVLSVVEPLPVYSYGPEGALIPPSVVEMERAKRFEEVEARIAEVRAGASGGPEWPISVQYGEPSTAVARVAESLGAQLVVMGIGPHKPLNRLLATETTLGAIRRVQCPVLAVSGDMRKLPRTVVVATDFDPASLHALSSALPLLAADATVYLVHTWSRSELTHATLRQAEDEYERSLPARFSRVRGMLDLPSSVTVENVALEGGPVRSILEFARDNGADLVVAGTHRRGLVERLFVGSVATALLRGAACSVLVAPEPPLVERIRLERHMTGTARSRTPADWPIALQEFTRRNAGRRARLEVDDRRLGAQLQETGYSLLGATYDPHDQRVELMLGDAESSVAHLTRGIGDVRSVAVLGGRGGRDEALCIENADGQTLLTFPREG